jgi:hypothetical protein
MLPWERSEFLLKGTYLGLLVMIAWLGPTWQDLAWVGVCILGGLLICLGWAAVGKLREGVQLRGRLVGFVLFLLLDNPVLVYTGLVGGLAFGTWLTFREQTPGWDALVPVGVGAVFGLVLDGLHHARDRKLRMWLGLALAGIPIAGAAAVLQYRPELLSAGQQTKLACLLLVGIPGFYLLTFASLVEESEAEIAAMCAALGISIWLLGRETSPSFVSIALAVPLALFYLYTRYVLPELRVFKHALRGLSFRQIGNTRLALVSLGRALQLDPNNKLAREQLWELHRELDVATLKQRPEILGLIDYQMCLERVRWLLLQDRPTAPQIGEARHLLDLIADQQPAFAPACAYWRAVAATHARDLDEASRELDSVLRLPQADTKPRRSVHFEAWQLALLLHPELQRRVGEPLLAQPGERMDAIAAVERKLAQAQAPDDSARDMQRLLYSELTEAEYNAAVAPGQAAEAFNHELAQQLGLALLDNTERWPRGCEYLRIAARGLPSLAPGMYIQIAQAHEKAGDAAGMWANYQRAMQLGRALGAQLQTLPAEEQKHLFTNVKKIGERAMAEGQNDAALEAFKLYSQYEGAGQLETYRTLAELFERRGRAANNDDDVWMALHCTEHALAYNGQDRDLLARKDRYYVTIQPADLQNRIEKVRGWFDVTYCLEKARFLLKNYQGDLDTLDWASHLADLAQTALPGSIAARFLRAQVKRERGEIPEAIALLENIRQNKPEKFANQDEADSWYYAHRLLGDLYLEDKADQALLCYQEFRASDHSGADTLYKMGRAYEALGDNARAVRFYEAVTGYPQHPLYFEARDALDRVKRGLGTAT